MGIAKVKIVGISPLLMNRFAMEKSDETKAKRRDEEYDITEDANKALYKEKDIGCYAPSTWNEAYLRDTAKEFKGKGMGIAEGNHIILGICRTRKDTAQEGYL